MGNRNRCLSEGVAMKPDKQPATEGEEEREWMALLNHSWAEDWNDCREDIYTLEDGKPSNESR